MLSFIVEIDLLNNVAINVCLINFEVGLFLSILGVESLEYSEDHQEVGRIYTLFLSN